MTMLAAPTLPGFEPAATSRGDSGLRDAAIATLKALEDTGTLTPRDALTAQLLVATAERAGIGLQQPKTTIATANLLKLLTELLDRLPVRDEQVSDAAQQFLAAITAAEAEAVVS